MAVFRLEAEISGLEEILREYDAQFVNIDKLIKSTEDETPTLDFKY